MVRFTTSKKRVAVDVVLRISTLVLVLIFVPRFFSLKSQCVDAWGLEPLGCLNVLFGLSVSLILLQALVDYAFSDHPIWFLMQVGLFVSFILLTMFLG